MKPLIKRLPSQKSYQQGIILYGADNLYPDRVIEVVLRAPITESALETTNTFLVGEGFSTNGDFQLEGKTMNRLLEEITPGFTLFKTPVAHLDVNLLGEIVEVTPLPFHFVRLAVPKKGTNEVRFVKVCPDWSAANKTNIKTYPRWPGSKEEAVEMMDEWNYETYGAFPGFVAYDPPVEDSYPLAFGDSVLDSSQSNAEIQTFELASIQNGFLSATILKHLGKIQDDSERERIATQVQSMTGAENANSVLVWEVPEGFDGEVLEQFPANNQDKLFEATNKTTTNRIVQNLRVPPQLMGIFPDSGFFTTQELQEAYLYFNTQTRRRRARLVEWFNTLAANFVTPMSFDSITELSYGNANATGN